MGAIKVLYYYYYYYYCCCCYYYIIITLRLGLVLTSEKKRVPPEGQKHTKRS